MNTQNMITRKNARLHYMILILVFELFVQFSSTIYCQTNVNDLNVSKPKQVEIAGTQQLQIKSTIANQDYVLYVNLPRDYSDTGKTFPVIYLLDAQWDFPLLNAIYGQQYFDGFIPSAIVVGITWGGENPNYDLLRAKDFTPTKMNNSSGDARKFLNVLKEELIPFINSKFRTVKNDRTLMGSSLGGLFTLYSLFNEPDLFNRYVLTSPALSWDNGIFYTYEKQYAEKNKTLAARLFIGIGEYEVPTDFQKFIDIVKTRNYQGFQLESKVLQGVGHSGGKAEGYTKGLQFVFAKPSLLLDDSVLKQYEGEYEIMPVMKIKITAENNRLVAAIRGQGTIVLNAETENDFYITGQYLLIHFQKNNEGKVTGFQLEQYTGNISVRKID